MCIALLSTSHPLYPFIFLSNRDEFLNRPTAPPTGGRNLTLTFSVAVISNELSRGHGWGLQEKAVLPF